MEENPNVEKKESSLKIKICSNTLKRNNKDGTNKVTELLPGITAGPSKSSSSLLGRSLSNDSASSSSSTHSSVSITSTGKSSTDVASYLKAIMSLASNQSLTLNSNQLSAMLLSNVSNNLSSNLMANAQVEKALTASLKQRAVQRQTKTVKTKSKMSRHYDSDFISGSSSSSSSIQNNILLKSKSFDLSSHDNNHLLCEKSFVEKYPGKHCILCNLSEKSTYGQGRMLRLESSRSDVDALVDPKSETIIDPHHMMCNALPFSDFFRMGYRKPQKQISQHFDQNGSYHIHSECFRWSSANDRATGEEEENFTLTIKTCLMSKRCVYCGGFGASIKCSIDSMRVYHLPCAFASGSFLLPSTKTLISEEKLDYVIDSVSSDVSYLYHDGDWKYGHISELDSSDTLKRMLCCTICGQHYLYMGDEGITAAIRAGWQCQKCKMCAVCRQSNHEEKFVLCQVCDSAYHSHCIAMGGGGNSNLSLNALKQSWKCERCRICRECGSRSMDNNGNAGQSPTKWYSNFSVCDACHVSSSSTNIKSKEVSTISTSSSTSCVICNKKGGGHMTLISCLNCKRHSHLECDLSVVKVDSSTDSYLCGLCDHKSSGGINQLIHETPVVGIGKGKPLMPPFRNVSTAKSVRQAKQNASPKKGARGMVGLQRPHAENVCDEGNALICVSEPFIISQDLCAMCGSIGTDLEGQLIVCTQCGQSYHPYCVSVKVSKVILQKGWRCLDCTVCEGCGEKNDEGNLILCDECDISYHTYCLDPPLKVVPHGAWKCKWCAVCHCCGTNSSSASSPTEWFDNYSLCGVCHSLTYCRICQISYCEGELIMKCEDCDRWNHATCDSIHSESEAEECNKLSYKCPSCRPNGQLPPHLAVFEERRRVEDEEQSKKKAKLEGERVEIEKEYELRMKSVTRCKSPSEFGGIQHTQLPPLTVIDDVSLTEIGAAVIKSQVVEKEKVAKTSGASSSGGGGHVGRRQSVQGKQQSTLDPDTTSESGKSGIDSVVVEKYKDGDIFKGSTTTIPGEGGSSGSASSHTPPEGFTLVPSKDNPTQFILRKKRVRDLKRVGIGGFIVKTRMDKRTDNSNVMTSSNHDQENTTGGDGETKEGTTTTVSSAASSRRRPKKQRISTLYPDYIQEAFFGPPPPPLSTNDSDQKEGENDESSKSSAASFLESMNWEQRLDEKERSELEVDHIQHPIHSSMYTLDLNEEMCKTFEDVKQRERERRIKRREVMIRRWKELKDRYVKERDEECEAAASLEKKQKEEARSTDATTTVNGSVKSEYANVGDDDVSMKVDDVDGQMTAGELVTETPMGDDDEMTYDDDDVELLPSDIFGDDIFSSLMSESESIQENADLVKSINDDAVAEASAAVENTDTERTEVSDSSASTNVDEEKGDVKPDVDTLKTEVDDSGVVSQDSVEKMMTTDEIKVESSESGKGGGQSSFADTLASLAPDLNLNSKEMEDIFNNIEEMNNEEEAAAAHQAAKHQSEDDANNYEKDKPNTTGSSNNVGEILTPDNAFNDPEIKQEIDTTLPASQQQQQQPSPHVNSAAPQIPVQNSVQRVFGVDQQKLFEQTGQQSPASRQFGNTGNNNVQYSPLPVTNHQTSIHGMGNNNEPTSSSPRASSGHMGMVANNPPVPMRSSPMTSPYHHQHPTPPHSNNQQSPNANSTPDSRQQPPMSVIGGGGGSMIRPLMPPGGGAGPVQYGMGGGVGGPFSQLHQQQQMMMRPPTIPPHQHQQHYAPSPNQQVLVGGGGGGGNNFSHLAAPNAPQSIMNKEGTSGKMVVMMRPPVDSMVPVVRGGGVPPTGGAGPSNTPPYVHSQQNNVPPSYLPTEGGGNDNVTGQNNGGGGDRSPGGGSGVQTAAPARGGKPAQRQSSQQTHRLQMIKWESDEVLGEGATIAMILYANKNHPNLKVDFPSWPDRIKQINKIWKNLPNGKRAPYVQLARENRTASRMNKQQSSSASTTNNGGGGGKCSTPRNINNPSPSSSSQDSVVSQNTPYGISNHDSSISQSPAAAFSSDNNGSSQQQQQSQNLVLDPSTGLLRPSNGPPCPQPNPILSPVSRNMPHGIMTPPPQQSNGPNIPSAPNVNTEGGGGNNSRYPPPPYPQVLPGQSAPVILQQRPAKYEEWLIPSQDQQQRVGGNGGAGSVVQLQQQQQQHAPPQIQTSDMMMGGGVGGPYRKVQQPMGQPQNQMVARMGMMQQQQQSQHVHMTNAREELENGNNDHSMDGKMKYGVSRGGGQSPMVEHGGNMTHNTQQYVGGNVNMGSGPILDPRQQQQQSMQSPRRFVPKSPNSPQIGVVGGPPSNEMIGQPHGGAVGCSPIHQPMSPMYGGGGGGPATGIIQGGPPPQMLRSQYGMGGPPLQKIPPSSTMKSPNDPMSRFGTSPSPGGGMNNVQQYSPVHHHQQHQQMQQQQRQNNAPSPFSAVNCPPSSTPPHTAPNMMGSSGPLGSPMHQQQQQYCGGMVQTNPNMAVGGVVGGGPPTMWPPPPSAQMFRGGGLAQQPSPLGPGPIRQHVMGMGSSEYNQGPPIYAVQQSPRPSASPRD